MDFKMFCCTMCSQMPVDRKLFFFQRCPHIICFPCIGTQTICLKCNTGCAIDASTDNLLMSVINFVGEILSATFDMKSEKPPDVADAVECKVEPIIKKRKLKPLLNDVAGPSSSSVRRTPRTVTFAPKNPEPHTEKSTQPARKRRRRSVSSEDKALKSDASNEEPLKPIDNAAEVESSFPVEPDVSAKENIKVEGLQETNSESGKTPPSAKKRRQRQAATKSPLQKPLKVEDDKKVLSPSNKIKAIVGDVTSPDKISKKNKMGETALHVAVRKNNFELVEELLGMGANPNVQDFAGWTPLHDAVTKGFDNIITCLLKHGALANIPGYENDTALHIAVEKMNKELVANLLKHGANPAAKNLYGLTPKALAEKSGDENIISLFSATTEVIETPEITPSAPAEPVTLFIGLLKKDQQALARKFAKQFKIKTDSDFYKASGVLIADPNPTIDWSLARTMAKGSFIISFHWCEQSLATHQLQALEKFLVYPGWLPGLPAAQNNNNLKRPGLFSGCEIKLGSTPQMLKKTGNYQWNDMTIDLDDLCRFVQAADGKLINRMPDPENPFRPNTVPYHVQPGPLERCSQIIIYFPGLWEPALKFNMAHVKCLPIQWLMDCILSFELKGDINCYFSA